ncbi:MAG: hypothetical protein L0Y72_25300 [Gemmataceae bacterium]|nr:hypothetical protein [Gemmataceae bacterium]MCI0742362.1 hypothetical protein [Gemmataceae bacterium]
MDFHMYLVIGGGALAVLAILLYLVPNTQIKLPAIIICSAAFLALGVGAGMVLYTLYPPTPPSAQAGDGKGGPPAGMMGMKGGAPGGMMGGAPGGMMGGGKKGGQGQGGPKGPSPKTQLVSFIGKLDVLSVKPLTVQLSDEQKSKILEQIKGLDDEDELTDDEATKRLETLAEVLKNHRETFEVAGVRWPGAQAKKDAAAGGKGAPANPFKDGDGAKHLQALQSRLEKK